MYKKKYRNIKLISQKRKNYFKKMTKILLNKGMFGKHLDI